MEYRIDDLPESALAAASVFYEAHLPAIGDAIASSDRAHLAVIFPPADHAHRGWRLAAIQQLARDHAPVRVNGIESADAKAISATAKYLANAPGLTGQLLRLDGNGAGALLSSDT